MSVTDEEATTPSASEDFLAGLVAQVDPAAVLVAVRDAQGQIVDFRYVAANDDACEFLEVPREVLVGGLFLELFPAHRTSGLFTRFVFVVETGTQLVRNDRTPVSAVRPRARIDLRGARISDDLLVLSWRDNTERATAMQALAESEARYRLLVEHSSDAVLLADLHDTIRFASPGIKAITGWEPEDLVGRTVFEFLHPEDRARNAVEFEMRDRGESVTMEGRIWTREGNYRWVASRITTVFDSSGNPTGRIGNWRDVDGEHHAREELAMSEARFRSAMDASPIGMTLVDLDRRILAVNPALCRMLDRDESWLLAHRVADILDPVDNEADLRMRADLLRGHHASAASEKQLERADGTRIWVHHVVALLTDVDDVAIGYIGQFLDVSDSVQAREALHFQATHDALTLVRNRDGLDEHIGQLFAHPSRSASPVGVLFIDVDALKEINDTHGHQGGDAVLVHVARRLLAAVRSDDIVARFGGDEFVVVLPEVGSLANLHEVARKILTTVAEPLWVGGERIEARVSIGATVARLDDDPEAVLSNADAALYAAKRAGRGRTAFRDPTEELDKNSTA